MQALKSNIISPYIKEFMTETTNSKELSLTIGERLAAIKIFDAFKGSISVLATIMDDVKSFPVTDEEWKGADLKKVVTYKTVVKATEKATFITKEYGVDAIDERTSYEASANTEEETTTLESENWKWAEKEPKEITVKQETANYLLAEINKKSDAGEVTIADVPLVSLLSKLK